MATTHENVNCLCGYDCSFLGISSPPLILTPRRYDASEENGDSLDQGRLEN